MRLDDFNYDLPAELIAQHPPSQRGASRLLHLDGRTGLLIDRAFPDLLQEVQPGDVLVFNDTAVIKARLSGVKKTGGRVEMLVERILAGDEVLALIRASHPPREGSTLEVAPGLLLTVMERRRDLYRLRSPVPPLQLLATHGSVPLPPYIDRAPTPDDEGRYQTVYARNPGAVAAPTAGLHFDDALMQALRGRGAVLAWLTLHVGAGTFQPVREDEIGDHVMHSEWYEIPVETVAAIRAARRRGRRVLAVGTTTLRALEGAAAAAGGELQPGVGETNVFIIPGYRFRVVDRLVTNFHLPRSTLLMLVSAFGGMDNIRRAYRHAVSRRYRFFSYGDAMLIERR